MSKLDQASVIFFEHVGLSEVPLVGGKNAALGEMYRELKSAGIAVPNGFAVTAAAYRAFLSTNGLDKLIEDTLEGLDPQNTRELRARGQTIRRAFLAGMLPTNVARSISVAYQKLSEEAGRECLDVAVRSSATAEDLPEASFAGQQETYLNIQGEQAVLDTVKRCFASLFTDRAISYRHDRGFSHTSVALSVGVQQMVRSDLAVSGVMFTLDTETGHPNFIVINAAYGLGETVVQGVVDPDEFYVFKPSLKQGLRPIVQRKRGAKLIKTVYDVGGGRSTRNVPVSQAAQEQYCLDDGEILTLARWAMRIEDHFSKKRATPTPMDIEWAKDGLTGDLFILQARPETVHATKRATHAIDVYSVDRKGEPILKGLAVGGKIASGRVRVIHRPEDLGTLKPGEILVAEKTDPDWEPVMKRAAAIVTSHGGRTCHAAIVSRELGVPAIVGANNALQVLQDSDVVTADCTQGAVGFVYPGALTFNKESIPVDSLAVPFTDVMLNVANPSEALRLSLLPNDGVGLARIEFIIASRIGIHPLALINYEVLTDGDVKNRIDELTVGYAEKTDYFITQLAEGVATIAAAFHPKDVIVRMSDFKTNEYAHLIGGAEFEPKEENPMIGFRGASRYYHDNYRGGFALECRAMQLVRDEMGLTNVKLMIPFCRTVAEGRKVLDEMAKNGLARGHNGLEVYVMCEVPSNVILADQFATLFDGFSIGSNDLTQLVLGVDRDSEILADLFDERDEAVQKMIQQVIDAAHAAKRKIGICGQAPSDYPEIVTFLLRCGIDSISLNPDVLINMRRIVAKIEEVGQDRAG